jgi:riboflavin kinase/FMN adenylyltransferase
VKTVPLAEDGGDTISSTRIRGLVGEGRVAEAASLLGRPHRIEGTVEHGAGRGRTLDAPTANLAVEAEAAVPAQGVYVTRALVDDRRIHPAVTSVGTNPTFEAGEDVHIETLFLDEGQDVYGRHMALDFIERVRGQKVFATADALTGQIKADADFAREYLRDHPIA